MTKKECRAPGCTAASRSRGCCSKHYGRLKRNGTFEFVGRRKPLAERLWAKVDRSGGPDACWPFTGAISPKGYGHIRNEAEIGTMIGAHRAAYLVTFPDREVPEVIDHICHDPRDCDKGRECPHRRCCNPKHLVPSTPAENGAGHRQWSKGFLTHCGRGHEFTEENTYLHRGKYRHCRTCARERRAA